MGVALIVRLGLEGIRGASYYGTRHKSAGSGKHGLHVFFGKWAKGREPWIQRVPGTEVLEDKTFLPLEELGDTRHFHRSVHHGYDSGPEALIRWILLKTASSISGVPTPVATL